MKLILLAAAAVIALPAMAQTSGSTGTSSPTSNGGKGTAVDSAVPNNTQGTMSTDPSTTTPAPMAQGTMPAQDTTATTSTSTMPTASATGEDPVGGYQPSTTFTPPPAGGTVVYQQAPSPDQAYPAPAPMAKYPMCKPGQFDNCMQGRGSTHSRQVRGRRSR